MFGKAVKELFIIFAIAILVFIFFVAFLGLLVTLQGSFKGWL